MSLTKVHPYKNGNDNLNMKKLKHEAETGEGRQQQFVYTSSTALYCLHPPATDDPSQRRNHLRPGTTLPVRSLRAHQSGPLGYRRSTPSTRLRWSRDLNLRSIPAKRQTTSPQPYPQDRPRSHECSRARDQAPSPSSS